MGRGTGMAEQAGASVVAQVSTGTRIKVFEHPLDGMRKNGAELLTIAESQRLPDLPEPHLARNTNMGQMAQVKLHGPGRSRIYITALDPHEHQAYGYVVSGRGPEHDRWDWFSLDEVASRIDADGNPTIFRDTAFGPKPVDECFGRTAKGLVEVGKGTSETTFRKLQLHRDVHPDELMLHELRTR